MNHSPPLVSGWLMDGDRRVWCLQPRPDISGDKFNYLSLASYSQPGRVMAGAGDKTNIGSRSHHIWPQGHGIINKLCSFRELSSLAMACLVTYLLHPILRARQEHVCSGLKIWERLRLWRLIMSPRCYNNGRDHWPPLMPTLALSRSIPTMAECEENICWTASRK